MNLIGKLNHDTFYAVARSSSWAPDIQGVRERRELRVDNVSYQFRFRAASWNLFLRPDNAKWDFIQTPDEKYPYEYADLRPLILLQGFAQMVALEHRHVWPGGLRMNAGHRARGRPPGDRACPVAPGESEMRTTAALQDPDVLLAGDLTVYRDRYGPERGRPRLSLSFFCPPCRHVHAVPWPDQREDTSLGPIDPPCRDCPWGDRRVFVAIHPERLTANRRVAEEFQASLRRHLIQRRLEDNSRSRERPTAHT